MLIDQHMQSADAVYVDFFNRPASTTSALAALALKTGAPVIPVFALPLPGGRFRMVYEHPIYTPESVAAQRRLPELNVGPVAYAGAYHGWGFHEDCALSGLTAARALGGQW